jgi:hypothetical protein
MKKIALATSFAVLLINSSALAETWSVSERLVSGINYASGTWNLNMQGDKLTGKAEMQIDNGTMLHYSLDGTVTGGVYSVTLVGRDDDKKNCVWTGKTADGQGGKVIAGQAECEGTKLYIRGGVQ